MKDIEFKEFPLEPSNIENIDAAVKEWVDVELNLHTTTNKGWEKVPVLWVGEERAHQIKKRKDIRDSKQTLIYPVIAIGRTSINRDIGNKGIFVRALNPRPGHDPRGGTIDIMTRIKQDKTANFENARALRKKGQMNFPRKKNNKTVYETLSVPIPVYVEMEYEITFLTEYQEQMNDIVQPLLVYSHGLDWVNLSRNGHLYEGFLEGDATQSNENHSMGDKRREFETTMKLKVLGYLLGGDKNEAVKKVSVRESQVEFKIEREHVIFGDIPEHTDIGEYRS